MDKIYSVVFFLLIGFFSTFTVFAQGIPSEDTLSTINLEDTHLIEANLNTLKKSCPIHVITRADKSFYLVQKNLSKTIASKDMIGRSLYLKQLFSSIASSYKDFSALTVEQNCFYSYGFLRMQSFVSTVYSALPTDVEYSSLSSLGVSSYLDVIAGYYSPYKDNLELLTDKTIKSLFDKNTDSSLSELSYLTEEIYYFVLYDLYRSDIITVEDIRTIIADTHFSFDESIDCGVYLGQYTQSHGSAGSRFAGINFRISTCLDWRLISQYEQTLKKLVLHELAHYLEIYYDDASNKFSELCWVGGVSKLCSKDDFVSKYAMFNDHEDYAETFSQFRIGEPQVKNSLILNKKYSHMMFTYPKS